MTEMVEEINAALADEIDAIIRDGSQPFQLLLPDCRLHSNSFVWQGRENRRKGVKPGVLGFANMFPDF